MLEQVVYPYRHIQRIVEERLRVETDPEIVKILKRAKRDPSERNLLAWRTRLPSRVPCMEPALSAGVIG